jgi:DNA-binding CsgD family transcriptional regulator/tetratricopeptide (TPR) repeat protein
LRGQCAEGRVWAERLVAALDEPPCGLVWAAAFLAGYAGDVVTSGELARVAAKAAQRVGDDRIHGRALIVVGMNEMFSAPEATVPVLANAAELAERAGDGWGRVEALQMLAYAHLIRGEPRGAVRHAEAAITTLNQLGHQQLRAWDAAIRAEASALTGRFEDAVILARRAVALATDVGEPVSAASALRPLASALCQLGRVDECVVELGAVAQFFAEHPAAGSRAMTGISAATAAVWRDASTATGDAEAAHAEASSSGLVWLVGESGALLALAELASGGAERAVDTASTTISTVETIGSVASTCAARLVWCAAQRTLGRNTPEVISVAHRVLADASNRTFFPLIADALDVIAGLVVERARWAVAARLHAASKRLRHEISCMPSPLVSLFRPADERAISEHLGPAELANAQAEGGRLTAVAAARYAARSRGRRERPKSGWASLTPTERDVVTLTTRGLSNRDIGAQLLISEGTVRTHLRSVFAKLGLRSRAELAAETARRDG